MIRNSPWLTIWTRPRETISHIVAIKPNQFIWVLAFIYGFLSLLNSFQSLSLGLSLDLKLIILLGIVFAPLWGYIAFSIWSYVVLFTGKILRGKGDFTCVRAAFAWSCVPLVVNIFLWVLLLAVFGMSLFQEFPQGVVLEKQHTALLFVVLIGKVVLAVWSLVIYINTLAQVQQFSIAKSICNIIFSWILFGIVAFLVYYASTYALAMGDVGSKAFFYLWNAGTLLEGLRI